MDLSFVSRHNTGTNAVAIPKYASNDDSSDPIRSAGIYGQGVNAGVVMSGQLDIRYTYLNQRSASGLGAQVDAPVPNKDDDADEETDPIVLMKITQFGIELVAQIKANTNAIGRASPPRGGSDQNSSTGIANYAISIRQINGDYLRPIANVQGTATAVTSASSSATGEEDKGGQARYRTDYYRTLYVSLSQYFTIAATKTSDEQYVITVNLEDVAEVKQYTFDFDLAIVNTDLSDVDERITKLFYATIQNITTTGYSAGMVVAKSIDIDSIDDTDKSNYATYTDIFTDAIDAFTLDGDEFVNINEAIQFNPVEKVISVVIAPVVPTVGYNSFKQTNYALTPSQYCNGKLVVINGNDIDIKIKGNTISQVVGFKPKTIPINNTTPFAGVHRIIFSVIVNRAIQQNYYRTGYLVIEHKAKNDLILNNLIVDYHK